MGKAGYLARLPFSQLQLSLLMAAKDRTRLLLEICLPPARDFNQLPTKTRQLHMETHKAQPQLLWKRFNQWWRWYPETGLCLDLSRVKFTEEWLDGMKRPLEAALEQMKRLEAGERVNVTEDRQVGHYWLRAPHLAPDQQTRYAIQKEQTRVKEFVEGVLKGRTSGAGGPFRHVIWIGIGGSALGPQLLYQCFANWHDTRLQFHFMDNTDPDGFCRILHRLKGRLGQTLCVVVSKSGSTRETNNGLAAVRYAYGQAGLSFQAHAIAITQPGTKMDQMATDEGWLNRFYIWEWVGGRTSITSAVGLLPLGLITQDVASIDSFLAGAAKCDEITRDENIRNNPAALLAAMWYYLGEGRGAKDMVVIPYKDRLELLPRYLQQLVMESLGKKQALDGRYVYQGLTVYGNKGSTDQHAYVQQLRDGLANFFVLFIDVLQELTLEDCSTAREALDIAADYLAGFFIGTRNALFESDRQSISITMKDLSPSSLGALIALFERTVGLYASLININAYDQPGVEAGKREAEKAVQIQHQLLQYLTNHPQEPFTPQQLADLIGLPDDAETIFRICWRLSTNHRYGIHARTGKTPEEFLFWKEQSH